MFILLKEVISEEDLTSSTTDCFTNIIKRYDVGFNHVLNRLNPQHKIVSNVLSSLKDHQIATKSDVLISTSYRPLFYIIFLKNLADFEQFIIANRKTINWNPRERIFIYYEENSVLELFKLAYKYNCINVTVYVEEESKVYTYYPITEDNNCGQKLEKELLHDCLNFPQNCIQKNPQNEAFNWQKLIGDNVSNKELINETATLRSNSSISTINFFPKKLPLTFYGCKIRPLFKVMWPYVIDPKDEKNPGLDVNVLRAITKKLNLTYDIVDHNKLQWGTRSSDGSYNGLYKILDEHGADIIVGMIIGNASLKHDFEETTYLHSDALAFFVPTAGPVENWKNLIILFEKRVWIGLGVAIFVAILTWWLIGFFQDDYEGYSNFVTCAFKVWCVIFSSFNRLPKSFLLRFLFVFWSFYAFIMTTTYQSVLIGFLTRRAYEKQITTFHDLAFSNIESGGFFMLRAFFNESGNKAFEKIHSNWKYCTLSQACVKRAAFDRNFGVVKTCKQMEYVIPKYYLDENGRPRVKRLKDTICELFIIYHAYKGFFYMERFNDVIMRLHSSGIISKWDRDVKNARKIVEQSNDIEPLSVTHLKPAFYALLIGNGFSIICFVFEKFINMKNKKTNSN